MNDNGYKNYCNSPNEVTPTKKLVTKIQKSPHSKKFKLGRCWSTDALFRETMEDIKKFAEQGALCVDMETSACVAVCNYRKIEVCSLLLISDLVHGGSWVKGFSNERLHTSIDDVVKTMIEIA